ncbi:MAG: hypothetical protein Tsb0014_40150 [Pleurocapsa sp.]
MHRRLLTFILVTLLGFIVTLTIPAIASNNSQALQLALQGQEQYNLGELDKAAKLWQQAAEIYEQNGDRIGATKSLINQSQALQDLGLYPKACRTLLVALTGDRLQCDEDAIEQLLVGINVKSRDNDVDRAIGLRSLGNILLKQGKLEQSKKVFQSSWLFGRDTTESSSILLSLGNVEKALGDRKRYGWDYEKISEIIDRQSAKLALESYLPAIKIYSEIYQTPTNPVITKLQAQLNHLGILVDAQTWWQQETQQRIESQSRLQEFALTRRATDFLSQLKSEQQEEIATIQSQIDALLVDLSPSHAGVYAQINYAHSLINLQKTNSVESILNNALQQSRVLSLRRGEAYALGYLGKYYAQEKQTEKAIALTRQALNLTQEQNLSGDAREISYLWQSQLGDLLQQQGESKNAIATYLSAVNTLQSLRADLNANDRIVQFDFRQEVRPVYIKLVDLLLSSDLTEEELNNLIVLNPTLIQAKSGQKTPPQLELARRVIESLQIAEIDNFFQDPCAEAGQKVVAIEDIDPQAAVIYPIILPDRLEIILSLPSKPLLGKVIPFSESQINATLDTLYDSLYNKSVDNSALNIIRTIPLDVSELEENTQKLLPIFQQIYSWLIQPWEEELNNSQIKTLVFVLNGRLQKVPMAALYDGKQYLLERYNIALAPSLQLINPQKKARKQLKVLAVGVSNQVEIKGQIFPALDNVPQELAQIKSTFPASKKLLNKDFTAIALQKQLRSDFSIVHLATHGLFSSNPEQTFIITGDKKTIGIEELSELLNKEKTTNPELIVLSACETATGDERAILGLAGVAVRSGTPSTLATLWSVGDESTAKLMGQFYQEYKEPKVTKIEALRKAQLFLLNSLKTQSQLPPHPYYWSPFVLVGNWQ